MFENRFTTQQELGKNKWKAPSVEELEAERNPLVPNNYVVVRNMLHFALGKIQRTQHLSNTDMKDLFARPFISRLDFDFSQEARQDTLVLLLNKYEKDSEALARNSINQVGIDLENTRIDAAMDFIRKLPEEAVPDMGGMGGLTNIYPHAGKGDLPTPEDEARIYRVNLALESNIGAMRVLVDIYKELCIDSILMQTGFKMKGYPGCADDNIIVYCGKKGLQSALQVVGNYCVREQVGLDVSGVPFGIQPLAHREKHYHGLSVTSHPKQYTFNELQATALYTVLEKLAADIGDKDIMHLRQETIDSIKKGLDESDTNFLLSLEDKYKEALEEMGIKYNSRNIAFSR